MSGITSIAAANKKKKKKLMKHDDINTQNTPSRQRKKHDNGNVEQLSNEKLNEPKVTIASILSSFRTGTPMMKKFHIINVNSVNRPSDFVQILLGKLDYPAGSKEWLQKEIEKLAAAAAAAENQIKPNTETGAAEKLQRLSQIQVCAIGQF